MSNNKIVNSLFNTLKNKGKGLFALLVLSVLFCSKINAQSVYFLAQEDFPNYEVHTGWPGTQTITGTTGTWTATVDQTYGDINVLNYTYQYSSPNAIRMQNNKGASTSTASITSPAINLSAYSCSGKVDLRFGIYTGKLTSSACSYYKVEYSNNGGSTWATAYQQTSAQLLASVSNPSGWNDITLLIGSSYLVSNFKYRITGVQSAGCGLNNEIWIDDAQIIALACRTSWTNICTDNKDVDLYTKSMTNSCANGSLGWTNIGTTEGLNMTNATQVKLYVSTSEQGNPSRTVTVRSKNASGAVVQTQTLSAPTSNQEDPSPINIYEFTFTSLSGVTSFEATASGGCSLINTSSSVVANGLALAVFRSSVTGYYNTGELVYWGAPGNGIWNYAKSFTLPVTAYTKTALVELTISGLYNNGKGARIRLETPGGSITTDVFNTDPTGGRLMKVFLPYNNIAGSDTWISIFTDDTYPQNGVYSIDAVKVSVSCTQPLNLGNIVFNDANNNGVKDGAEVGIAGVTVNLYQDANADNVPDGKILFSTVTDASGNYNFTGLTAGNYIVGVIIPNGYTSAITTGTSSNPNNDTDNDNNGVNLVNSGTELRTNYITLSAAGEPTTDGDGNYGNLTLDLGLKTNTCVKTTETFPNTFNTGFTAPINSTFAGSTGTWAAYSTNSYSTVLCTTPYYLPSTSQAIKLLASATNGGNTDTWCAATSPTINASGNCCPMQTKLNFTLWTYEMNVNDPWSNFSVDMSGDGGTTWTTNYTITAEAMYNLYGTYGKVNLSIPIPTNLQTSNFKYRFSLYNAWNTSYNFYLFVDDVTISSPVTCGTGSIGNYVWNDLNYNGTQDIGEVGISGATVTLLDNNGSIIASTTTNASGNYTFSNLPAGTYQVAFTTPSGYTATLANQGADDNLDSDPMSSTQSYDPLTARVKNITLTNGQNRTDIDAGFFSTCSAIFTETFPNTFNTGYTTPTNGTFVGNTGTWTVASTSGYAGAVVESNGSTNLLKTINYYDASGTLSTVTITSPTGDIVTPNGACTAVAYLNFDMYPNYINTPPGSNAYKVYIDFSGNGGSTWTNVWAMNGAEILDAYGLNSTYNITIPIASAYYTTTFRFRLRAVQQSGAYCDNYILYDNFKIGKCPCPSLNLGNTVWIDTNGNGVKDGAEVGYNGATVKLYADNNGDNTPDGAAIATTTTNASGVYAFSNLLPGAYIVGVTLPSGYASTVSVATTANPNNDTDNDNNGVTTVSGELRSNYITLSVGGEPASGVDGDGTNGNLTLDFGIVSQSMSISTATTVCAPTNSNTYTLNGQVTFSSAPSTGTLTVSVQGGHSVVFSAPFTSPLSYTLDGLIADGASRSVTATFSATSASASATYTAPSAIGSGFYNFPLNTFISDLFWGMSPYPQIGWNNVYVPGFGGPYDVGGGVHDLDLSPAGVTNMAAFCAEMAEASESNYHIINKYKIAPLENINRGRAGESGTESANIPSGGIGRVRAGMIRYLYDNYYTSTDANAWTASNAGAFQLAVWELLHEKYTSNNSFTITSASTNGFYVLATYNTASVTQAQGYLNAINTLNWTDAQWMSYKSTAWHVIALEANNDTNPGTPDGQDFLIAQPIVGACVLNLGNIVWVDTNGNGVKDGAEVGYSGATVKLYRDANSDNTPDGAAIATTTTNASGIYSFANLATGNYIVGVTLPVGYTTTISNTNPNGDIDNDNNGVTIYAGELRSNYITLTPGSEPASGTDGDGTNGNLTLDFGIITTGLVSCSGSTFNPVGAANGYNAFIQNSVTAQNGHTDAGLALGGDLTLNGSIITGMAQSGYYPLGFNNPNNYVLVIGGKINYTAGGITYVNSLGDVKLGNTTGTTIWNTDPNGATVNLKFTSNALTGWSGYNSTPSIQMNSLQSAATVTTSSGLDFTSAFSNLVTNSTTISNYSAASPCIANLNIISLSGTTPTITLVSNKVNVINITGAYLNTITSITFASAPNATTPVVFNINQASSFTWNGFNVPGFSNPDSKYILYNFYNNTGTITINGTSSAVFGTVLAPSATVIWNNSNNLEGQLIAKAATLNGGELHNQPFSACLPTCDNILNLGNIVWFDANNNGIKDAAETGVSGATVKIYADANADNTPDGAALNTTTTNASGVYNFSNLPAGNYIVGVTLPTGYVATTTTVNSTNPNSDTDNDNNGVTTVSGELRSNYITLSIGGEPASGVDGDGTNGNLTLDFGLIGSLNLGNLIWNDTNGNGVKDAFESGINGLTVYLYQDANGDNTPDGTAITTTTTSGGGFYGFSNLPAGNYIVGYTLPTGYANTFKPANNANPNSDTNNDNNGVTRIGNEIRSNYITLSVGGEPASGVDGDGTNGNWTLDFGCAKDTDGDLIPDVIDIDDDNDGITDVKESGGYDPLADCDADGIPNYLDSTPGCTTPSGNDAWGNPFTPLTWTDCNSDGINDFFDKDRDGIINELDLDSDNDGILDVQEARPGGVAVGSTLNGQITGTDADADGLLSSQDINAASPYNDGIAAQDLDRDGIPNFLDLDSDGDGINDLTEALNSYDADGILTSADSDGDGVRAESFGSSASNIADNINGLGAKGISLLDTDGDGKPNAYDIDSDADGITDNAEGQATCSYILPTGTDCDKDGVDDAYEAGGSCACAGRSTAGVTPYDKDGDSTPDYLDSDTDGDGITDIYEGHTVKTANYWTGSTGDADGDGLIDYFDTFNMSSAVSNFFRNVVNKNMGTNGSWYEGTGGVGSASQLPESDGKDCSTGGDRDWRNVTILPTTLTSFTASLNNSKVANVKWTVTNEINMNSYAVERSVDGVTFKTIATRTAINPSSVSTSINYTADDDLSSITNSVVYYRIKMTDKNNTSKYSNVISFKLYDKVIVGIMVNPNPATTHFTLKVTSVKEEKIQVRIVDNLGKVMTTQSTTITSGVNSILFNDLTKFASGLYSVQVVMNGEVYTDKLIIAK